MQRFERLAATISRYSPGKTVLEIGPGDGELAKILIQSGYDYHGVERNPRVNLPNVVEADFFDFESATRFNCVLTQYVLHHVKSIDDFVNRMLHFAEPNGIIAIGEYGWERTDDPIFRKERADMHTSETMLRALDDRLERIHYEDVPYKDGDDAMGFIWIGRRKQ